MILTVWLRKSLIRETAGIIISARFPSSAEGSFPGYIAEIFPYPIPMQSEYTISPNRDSSHAGPVVAPKSAFAEIPIPSNTL